MDELEITIEGHDHFAYEINKVYSGSNFIHISRAMVGTLAGSDRIQHLTIHIDEVDDIIHALQALRNR